MENHQHDLNQKKCCGEQKESKLSNIKILREKWLNFKPLIIILIFCIVLPLVQNDIKDHHFMYSFMGYFFVFLSLFKFFDLKGFVDGFSTYDLVTKRFRIYGYVYPFIELFLGIAYLAKFELHIINWITVILMTVSGLGVLKSIYSGQKIKCACLGTVLNVPLSSVSVLENFGMGAMALVMAVSESN